MVPVPPCSTDSAVVNPESEVMSGLAPETAEGRTVQLVLPGLQDGVNVSVGAYGVLGGAANATELNEKREPSTKVDNATLSNRTCLIEKYN